MGGKFPLEKGSWGCKRKHCLDIFLCLRNCVYVWTYSILEEKKTADTGIMAFLIKKKKSNCLKENFTLHKKPDIE